MKLFQSASSATKVRLSTTKAKRHTSLTVETTYGNAAAMVIHPQRMLWIVFRCRIDEDSPWSPKGADQSSEHDMN